jgi:hypothetical protein
MVRSRWGINLVATRKTYGNKLKSSVIFIAILLVMMKPGRFSGHRPFGRNPPLGMGLARGPFFGKHAECERIASRRDGVKSVGN